VFDAELVPVAGVVDALDAITLPTCVASSGTHEYLRYALGLTGLYARFAGRIFSAEDVVNDKPAPDIFLHAAVEMGVAPAECVVVEDSRSGVEAARSAGMRTLAFAGGCSPAALLDGRDTIVFEDMRELPRLLDRRGPLFPRHRRTARDPEAICICSADESSRDPSDVVSAAFTGAGRRL
jgi:beta-phosphoglucomutase-like phosphatase (HAD superfamily)